MKGRLFQKSSALLLALTLTALSLSAAAHPADTLRKGAGISVRTNLLWDALSEPNLSIEFPVGDHVTVGATGGLKSWPRWLAWDWDQDNPVHWRNFAVAPQARYYFKQVYDGFFVGSDFVYTHFNVGAVEFPFGLYPEAKNERLQGSFWGGGATAGYSLWFMQHWRLEAEIGLAAGLAAYDRFDCPHCGEQKGVERKPALVPKLAVSIAYNPVSKATVAQRRAARNAVVVSGTDTVTVLTPPVAFVVHLKDVKGPATAGDRLAQREPWVLPIQEYRPLDYLTRPGRDSILCVQYSVNSAELKRNYPLVPMEALNRNGKVLDQLVKAIEEVRDDPTTSEILVSIVGLSSIEGPQELNDTLAIRRARAVADYLHEKTYINRRFFETIGKGEAWDWLRDQLYAIPEGGCGLTAQEVQTLVEIVENEPAQDQRERRIKKNPELYAKVVENLLSDQRNAGYIRLYYNNVPDAASEKLNGPVRSLLEQRRFHDAVRAIQADETLMERVHSNPEAANAYGVALYFTALDNKDARAEEEALQLLKKAAEEGSVSAAENLKGIEIYGPARKEYEAWKEIMDNSNNN